MKFFLIIFLFIAPIDIMAQDPDSAWIRKNYTKIERYIPMRDGVRLFTSIYIPKDTLEEHPVLLTRTPYSCRPYGEQNWKDYWNSFRSIYLKEKYILVTQDVRGKWMSEGEFRDVRPFNPDKKGRETDEAGDSWDTIEWLLANIPYNNGNVGVYGISYPGFYSTMAAASGHPALKAVSPQAPVTNWFIGDDFHHHGAFFLMDAFAFYVGRGFGLPHRGPTDREAPKFEYYSHDNYKFYLETGALRNFSDLAGDSVRFWNEMFEHPNYDDWWKVRDARNATHDLKPAILWVGGEFDAEDHWGAWNSYLAAETNNPGKDFNNLVMGPWWHGQWETSEGTHLGNIFFGSNTSLWYQENIEVPFFNYYLKGKGDISHIAEATVFFTGENVWKEFDDWPPEEMNIKELNLIKNGSLSWEQPVDPDGFTEYPSDPSHPVPYTEDVHFNRTRNYMVDDQRFAERRPDVATFKTDILREDVTIAGEVVADLFTSISTTDADFVVKLIDVFPDSLSFSDVDIYSTSDPEFSYPMGGYEMLVHGEVMRGRYRNSYEYPEAFVPGKIERVKFSIGNIAHTFKRGHRIMVQIQSSWFPLVDRNPQQFIDIYHCQDEDFIRADIRIHHNREFVSRILIPVLDQR
ncbi:MAG: CocE/NonD family hydrolase [Cyclobacteriaceae bacterium]|nr:CocE/NonD family hydrolase [Cyclobacteriaceae bacterium]